MLCGMVAVRACAILQKLLANIWAAPDMRCFSNNFTYGGNCIFSFHIFGPESDYHPLRMLKGTSQSVSNCQNSPPHRTAMYRGVQCI